MSLVYFMQYFSVFFILVCVHLVFCVFPLLIAQAVRCSHHAEVNRLTNFVDVKGD